MFFIHIDFILAIQYMTTHDKHGHFETIHYYIWGTSMTIATMNYE